MKQQHHPHDIRTYSKGANRDTEEEFLGATEGEYIDACNMHTISMDGDNASVKKIRGEKLLYPNIDNRCSGGTGLPLSDTYACIGIEDVNNNIVEFWADKDKTGDSLIRINGTIVLMSEDFPITADSPLQIHKNESCIGGEIYISDFKVLPMIFNVQDLMDNGGIGEGGACTEKYFEEFNIQEHILILTQSLNRPAFIKLTSSSTGIDQVLGAGGLPVGYYTYSFRYVTDDGERTAFSAPTPQIPVVKTFTENCSPQYPYSHTISKDPDVSSPSTLGVHFRLRVNNENNYDFIEIKRNRWNAGSPVGTPAISEIIGKIDIADGDIEVLNFLDLGDNVEEVLPLDAGTDVMAALEKAKALRYFNNKLYLMNVSYASRDIDDKVEFLGSDSNRMFPTIEKMGKAGHSDPWHYTYHKSFFRGEKNGFGVILWDEQGEKTYAKKVDGFENFNFPNRRDEVASGSDTEDTSYRGTVKAANVDGSVTQTHEVFDLRNAVTKTDKCSYMNIMEKGNKLTTTVNIVGCPTAEDEDLHRDLLGVPTPFAFAENIGYRPFTPVSQDDGTCNGHNYRVNLRVRNGGLPSSWENYQPKGFAPTYYSQGIGFKGISEYPSWAKAFSIVRTKSAQKVVAQGIGFYRLESAGSNPLFGDNTTKKPRQIWFYSPDTDAGIGLDPTVIEDIKLNPTSYQIRAVSPLGFFTEIFSYDNVLTRDKGVDMITYCRIIDDLIGTAAEINPDENSSAGINPAVPDGRFYTAYGKWRSSNLPVTGAFTGAAGGNTVFDIPAGGVSDAVDAGRGAYLEIDITSDLWVHPTADGKISGDEPEVQDWHEPVYIINIEKKLADVPDTNITEYEFMGHYQKFESVIGEGNGEISQVFRLVDERWEDCINTVSGLTTNPFFSLEKFVYIRDDDGTSKRWVNVTQKTPVEINTILTALDSFGVATVTDSSGSYKVYGVYKDEETFDLSAPVYDLKFEWFDTSFNRDFFIPDVNQLVVVKYDSRIPIRAFGGDASIGEAIFAPIDKQYNKNGNIPAADDFRLNISFPYRMYELNPRQYVVNRTTGINKIQDGTNFRFDDLAGAEPSSIRQLCAMFTCESRINLNYAFNLEEPLESNSQTMPLKNYVMRPYRWSDSKFENTAAEVYDDNNVQDDYETDYGSEFLNWGWGGFRFLPQVNIDYSKEENSLGGLTSVPKVGFEEQNDFCTRVIWSEERPVNIQDTPSVRTFLASNAYDISDNTGEIKFAWDEISVKGNNLYALTERGVCLLLVDKRIISEINANELATAGSDIGGITTELWINKEIGISDEMWRSTAEYSNQLFFCNYDSAYKLANAQIEDIGRKNYHSKLYLEFLQDFGVGYEDHVTAVYDVYFNQYRVNFKRINTGRAGARGWCVYDKLDLVNTEYDAKIEGVDPLTTCDDKDMGVTEGEIIEIYPDPNYIGQPVVYIGGDKFTLLNVPITVCVPEGQTKSIAVGYASGSPSFPSSSLVEVGVGECYCFTPTGEIGVENKQVLYTAEKCDVLEQFTCPTLVYGAAQGAWQGGFDFEFERFLSIGNDSFGVRGMETYRLNEGFTINGAPIKAEVIGFSAKEQAADKEFIRLRVNSDKKPVKVEFFDNSQQAFDGDVQAELDTVANPLALKNYYGFEQYIPRKTELPRDRMQGRIMVYKIIHNLEEDFKVIDTDVQYKTLK